MSENVLVLGATSAIARAVCEQMAQRGDNLLLAGRDADDLARTAADLRLRYGIVAEVRPLEALRFAEHAGFFAKCVQSFDGGLDGVVFCLGCMAEQSEAAADFSVAQKMIDTNYTAAVSLLNLAADYFELRGSGYVCALSSVAGDRGRQSNYLYGATKAALTAYLQGLRNRLTPHGVTVITVKPGCVDTAMTYGLDKLPLLVEPRRVAADICRGIQRRRATVYTPWFWRPIMQAICLIPEQVFARMKL